MVVVAPDNSCVNTTRGDIPPAGSPRALQGDHGFSLGLSAQMAVLAQMFYPHRIGSSPTRGPLGLPLSLICPALLIDSHLSYILHK